ncbi:thiamine biosynthesis protein ThiS [Ammoniphilus oxalaticus]|uniref:Thiamine biosynthesis protein ThiS n=1 Tax=Ammoniphilus oxalaticus TaxID=66863 RepID=A0A419SEW8_9BACL|nr:sulfur carrier protein ThiS [Ammoniphilus oxalaticus]RKD21764.1 thiamine biosynthesis protein ThiS [Ammoniphilus oxalaticus]
MNLVINGDQIEVPDSLEFISDLLQHFELGEKVVIVEVNASILEKDQHAKTRLTNGDRIEIVHFVGGG